MHRSVVITGLGVVSAAGIGADAFWRALESGRSAIGPIRAFDASGFPCRLGGEIDGADARPYVPKSYRKATKVMARDTELAVIAAQLAVADAGVATRGSGEASEAATGPDAPRLDPDRTGCQIGAGLLTAEINELTAALHTSRGENGFDVRKWGSAEGGGGAMDNLPPLWMLKYLPNMLACHVTIIHGAEGPSNTITCAEASGLLSLGESARVIERGDADACFSGGVESKINPVGLLRLTYEGRLAETGDATDSGEIVRPYDPDAPGGVPGEGGAIFLIEEGSKASVRGKGRAYARLAGFGAAHSGGPLFPGVFDGDPGDGFADSGIERAVRAALADAGITPGEVDAIVPGAFGVASCDRGERNALAAVFGARLAEIETITITPTVGLTAAGHGSLLAAAGALAIKHQRLPARRHGGTPHASMRVGPTDARDASLRTVLVCTPSLGGQVGAIVLTRHGETG
ncbi:MAG: hypothetical protein H6810_01195 [Phycisphaeraceae bacterium]|nr:MAG: hypothetical protein H6810_01195 [Phycisphaeraceae bacterium]